MATEQKKWTEGTALDALKRVGVMPMSDKTFEVNGTQGIGMAAWGAMDYLKHNHGYKQSRVREQRHPY